MTANSIATTTMAANSQERSLQILSAWSSTRVNRETGSMGRNSSGLPSQMGTGGLGCAGFTKHCFHCLSVDGIIRLWVNAY